jgi:arylsulfatase A-like enzyme
VSEGPPAQRDAFAIPHAILVGVWLGLVAGLLELPLVAFKRWVLGLPVYLTPQVVWAAPVTYAVVLGATAALLALIGKRLRPLGTARSVVLVAGFLGSFSAIKVFHIQLHDAAELLLAVGIAWRASAAAAKHPDALTRLARRSAVPLAATVVVLGIGVNAARVVGERRALASLAPVKPGAPNVLLLILDTVRAASMSLYGHPRPTTPQLERLAAGAVVFERAATTSSWSNPSHASLVTGHFPYNVSADWGVDLDDAHPTLAEVLQRAGYRTAAFSANTRYFSRQSGFGRGFARFDDFPILSVGATLRATWLGSQIAARRERVCRFFGTACRPGRKDATDVLGPLQDWIAGGGERPFFAAANLIDAHTPYQPPEPFAQRFSSGTPRSGWARLLGRLGRLVGRQLPAPGPPVPERVRRFEAYEGTIAYLDHQLGRLFDDLQRSGVLRNTLVILTADHGEEFGEHGTFLHGRSLYWPVIHVPLVVWLPGGEPAGLRVREPVSIRSIPATAADVVGLAEHPLPGRSLARAWNGAGSVGDTVLIELTREPAIPLEARAPVAKGDMRAVILGSLHYIRNGDGSEELYDLDTDPWERDNLIGRAHVAAVAPLRATIEAMPVRERLVRRSFH